MMCHLHPLVLGSGDVAPTLSGLGRFFGAKGGLHFTRIEQIGYSTSGPYGSTHHPRTEQIVGAEVGHFADVSSRDGAHSESRSGPCCLTHHPGAEQIVRAEAGHVV
jgi:hypothetical protein